MKQIKTLYLYLFLAIALSVFSNSKIVAAEADSAYIFAYEVNNGLSVAWSIDGENWHTIGNGYNFLRSDYGRWDSQKRMYKPFLFQAPNGLWHCVWSVNDTDGVLAHAASKDLIYWQRQSYPIVMENANCIDPFITYDTQTGKYTAVWSSNTGEAASYSATTNDFKEYTAAVKRVKASSSAEQRQTAMISSHLKAGTTHKVAWHVVEGLINKQKLVAYNNLLWSENSKNDPERFASLTPIDANIIVQNSKSKKISDKLLGIFFEDINYAADGGLYAELLQNRDFEYVLNDKEGKDKNWNSYYAWSVNGSSATFTIDTVSPIHPNNKHYAVLEISKIGVGLANEGFDGISLKAGEKYDFSIFARSAESRTGKLLIRLIGKNGEIYGENTTKALSSKWEKQEVVITAKQTVSNASLEVIPQMTGEVHLDMISLFPQKTFKSRKNGLRADLAQAIADMKPKFVRFPGGCVVHGDGLDNIYRWENTIGPVEERKPQRNLWGYHQTAGLGYFEYFQFCEDIGAEPVPVVAAGVPCQNSAHHGHPIGGQQGGIPMSEMNAYIKEILNLIEWANGDANTTWGKKRAQAGHPEPYNLRYIGVGNEDLISDIFEERFTMIYNAIKKAYPDIIVIGTAGAFYKGSTDYVEGWDVVNKLDVPMIDEHYYQSPGWFIHNQDYYDSYSRSKAKVYLGEYAAHLPGRPSNLETALAEALHLVNLERNGDVVSMASYAPLLAKEGHTQWSPDLIYFNNTTVKPTIGYYVQQLFGQNAGNEYLPSMVTLSNDQDAVTKRVGISVVRDSISRDLIVKLVNLLPVAVNSALDLTDVGKIDASATKTVLQGKPVSNDIKPVQSTVKVSEKFNAELPAYSFTVFRIRTEASAK
ncbi:MAG TPA: alpha-L-arabinofuranosidase C-terminal domain-containing protein [Pseudosphingobacterium sp.]|nr:alpha-L-arabinofuranosidase C-terminal domain-containing protein [Pseudosphingobacterium sp.]